MARIPDETLQAIRDRVSLVEVVSAYVSLKRAGQNYSGLCPFHSEKSPSFTVSDDRGLFHCFGCGVGGTVFNFLMQIEGVDFLQAVEQLAKRAGVELPERGSGDPAAAQREQMYAANEHAQRFFAQALRADGGTAARRYLAARGLKKEVIERYGLGFAPPGGNALSAWLTREKVPRDLALQVGLLGRRDDGSVYDRFRGRIIFPIRDRRERTVAFGARTLGNDQPKYLNSPESPIFRKGRGLYGLPEARESIRSADRVVLVEGYLDALVLAQEGVPYAVATLGTALTAVQLRLLGPMGGDRLTVFFFFDGDKAGRNAALRAFAVSAEAGAWGKVAFLPEGSDPDSFIRQHGSEATLALLDNAVPLIDYYLDTVVPPGAALPERTRAAEELKRVLAGMTDEVRFELIASRAATRLGVSDEIFRRARSRPVVATVASPVASPANWPVAERGLVEAIALDGEIASWVTISGALALFTDQGLAAAGQKLVEAWENHRPVAEVMESLPPALASRLGEVLLGDGPLSEPTNRMQMAQDYVARLRQRAERTKRQAMVAAVRRADRDGDASSSREALGQLSELRRREGGAV